MSLTRRLAFSALLISLSQPIQSKPVTSRVYFSVSEQTTDYSIEFSTGGFASAQPTINGSFSAVIEWDDETLVASRFHTEIPGTISWQDFQISVQTQLNPPQAGPLDSKWTFDFSNLRTLIEYGGTSNAPISATGQLDLDTLTIVTNSGSSTATIELPGQFLQTDHYYPDDPSPLELTVPPYLKITKTGGDLRGGQYEFNLDFTYNERITEKYADLGTTVTIVESGNFRYSGSTNTVTPFNDWAYRAGGQYSEFKHGAVSQKWAIPIEIAYALNMDFRPRNFEFPLQLSTTDESIQFRVPSSRRNDTVMIEYSTDLTSKGWQSVPVDWIEGGVESLETGSFGHIVVDVPPGHPNAFFRLRPLMENL